MTPANPVAPKSAPLSEPTREELRLARMFKYLDNLRESGAANMFGARPYVAQAFKLGDKRAGEVLQAWMRTFSHEVTPLERAQAALQSASAP